MKSSQIKIWPEIDGFLSIIAPWQNVENKENDVFIDFSNCQTVTSSYLVLLLIRVIKLLNNKNNIQKWETHDEIVSKTFNYIIDLNFFNILDFYGNNASMFWNNEFSKLTETLLIHKNRNNNEIHSFPIYHICIKNYNDRREVLKLFRRKFNKLLSPYFKDYNFNLSQLTLILNEILKNSADHTDSNAFLGMDIEFINESEIEISIGIGDLGVGINMNIKNHLPEEQLKRYNFWDLTQTYKFALSKGGTTKMDSLNNKGMGMSIILDGARELGMELSVFDADSRGLLTKVKSLTHSDVRKNFYNMGRTVGFYYHGKLKAKKL
jgi:hypothetical protein